MANKIEEYKTMINKELTDKSKPWTKWFDLLEAKSGVPRLYAFIGGAVLVALYIAFGYAGQILCNIIGVAYPTYISMKAIESKQTADDTKWLTYWVLFSCFTIFEQVFVFVTNFIPLYWLIKCIFYIWCMAPIENNGSVYLYHKVIRPHFLKHENVADDLINNAFDKAKKVAGDIISKKGD